MPLSPWGESRFFLMIHAVGDCPDLPKPWVNSADMAIEAVGAYIQTSDLSSHASFYQCRMDDITICPTLHGAGS